MLDKIVHGGRCCGVSHLFGFGQRPLNEVGPNGPNNTVARLDEELELFRTWEGERDYENEEERIRAGLVEVILTDAQMVAWAPILKERRFRLVTRFFNSNSGNHCNVLHKTFGNTTGANRPARPFEW